MNIQVNVLPTEKEATAPRITASTTNQVNNDDQQCCPPPDVAALLRDLFTLRQEATWRMLRRRGLQREKQPTEAEDQENQQRILSDDGSLLWRCPVDVLLGGERPLAAAAFTRQDRRRGGGGVPRVPRRTTGATATANAAAGLHQAPGGSTDGDNVRVCSHPAPGCDELERRSAYDRMSNVALGGSGLAIGYFEASAQLSERQGSRLHLLQSQPLVPDAAAQGTVHR